MKRDLSAVRRSDGESLRATSLMRHTFGTQPREARTSTKLRREYLRMLRTLNPNYDAKAAMSVVVMKRPS
jgi:hypothetical protein